MKIDWANKTRLEAVADGETGTESSSTLFIEKTGCLVAMGGKG